MRARARPPDAGRRPWRPPAPPQVAKEGLLDTEGFYWIPNLAGPTSIDVRGTEWLFPFVGGAPPIGWDDGARYLALPLLLIAAQYVSSSIITPPVRRAAPRAPPRLPRGRPQALATGRRGRAGHDAPRRPLTRAPPPPHARARRSTPRRRAPPRSARSQWGCP